MDLSAGRYSTLALTLLRVITGFLFMPHGAQKLFAWLGGMKGEGASASFPSLIWFAGALEFFGGLCMILGLGTRPVAFLLSGLMAVAYFMAHAPGASGPCSITGRWPSCTALSFCSSRPTAAGRIPWSGCGGKGEVTCATC